VEKRIGKGDIFSSFRGGRGGKRLPDEFDEKQMEGDGRLPTREGGELVLFPIKGKEESFRTNANKSPSIRRSAI